MWTVWFGKSIATAVLTPLAVFFTYKANKDSTVFNVDMYRSLVMKMLGLRIKRVVYRKEVIINDPDYESDAQELAALNDEITAYAHEHKLLHAPNVIKVFFRYNKDNAIEQISGRMETVIEDLSNTRDKVILSALNTYPFMAVKAHTRPFEHKWMNVMAAVIVPVGLFLYFRMWRFRLRLMHDLKIIRQTNEVIIKRINKISNPD